MATKTFGDKNQYTYNIDAQGNPYGAPLKPTDLTETSKYNLPDNKPQDFSTIRGDISGTSALLKSEQEKQDFISQRQDENAKLLSLMLETGKEDSLTKQYAMEEGAYDAKRAYDEYVSKIESEDLSLRRQTDRLRENLSGASAFGIESQINEIERKSLSKQADLAILQNAASRRYDTAMSIAKDKAEMELAPKKAELEALKYIIENNKWAQQMELQSIYDRRKKEIENEQKDKDAINEMIINAIQGKAPQSLITKAQELYNQGKSSTEVAKILGNYSLSLADRLDVQYKQAQINKLNEELTTKNPDVGELVKINGKDYIRYKDGTISDPLLPEAKDTSMVVSRLDEKIKAIDSLTKNNGGVPLATSAGSLRGAPIPFAFKNQINDWRAGVINLTQKLTVDELGRVKSDGVTFGQLSNGERLAVGQAATILNSGMITEGEGDDRKPTGKFKLSEKKVLESLDTIRNAYLLDFERRTGVTYDEYLTNPDALKQKLVDEFLDGSGTVLESSNYGGYTLE